MKRIIVCLAVFAVFGMVPFGTGHCAGVSVESQAGLPAFGPRTTQLPIDGNWGESGPSALIETVDPSWPQIPPDVAWITTETANDPTADSYSLFTDGFTPACTAQNMLGTLQTASNTSEEIYLNGVQIGTAQNAVTSLDFAPVTGKNKLAFLVTTTGVAGAANPVGLTYKADVTYDLPEVVWRPPIVHTKRTIVKNGTTLPIKFSLAYQGLPITSMQNIYLTISGGGADVARFELGHGPTGLMFVPGGGKYKAIFHTKNYTLQKATEYTATVKDGCSNQELGSIKFQVFSRTR